MSTATVSFKRTASKDVKVAQVDGADYTVTKVGGAYFVTKVVQSVVAEVGSYKAAREAVAKDAGVTEKADKGPKPAEVRAWAKATGRFSGSRGVLPRELFAQFEARPAGAWRKPNGKFVKA